MPIVFIVGLTVTMLALLLRAQTGVASVNHVAFIRPMSSLLTALLSTVLYVAGFAGLVLFVGQMLNAVLAVAIVV